MTAPISYDSLAAGEGTAIFGESWEAFAVWLKAVDSMSAPTSHKVWACASLLSMLTNDAQQRVYSSHLGHVRLNLGVMYVGHIQAVIENLIRLVEELARTARVPLGPTDTDGHRQGFIAALQGYAPTQRKRVEKPLGVSKQKGLNGRLDPAAVAKLQALLTGAGTEDSLKAFATASTDAVAPTETKHQIPRRPTGLIVPYLRGFIKDSYVDMTQLLAQCLGNQRIDIQQQLHRYLVNEPALSILTAANTEDLVGRGSYVNRQFLAQMIPVYNEVHYGTAQRMPLAQQFAPARDWITELSQTAIQMHEYRLTEEGRAQFSAVAEMRMRTTNLHMIGLSDRRVYHLIRLAGIIAFARKATEIDGNDVRLANTLLVLNESTAEMCYSTLLADRSDIRVFLKVLEYLAIHETAEVEELVAHLKSQLNVRDIELVASIERFYLTAKLVPDAQNESRVRLNHFGADERLQALTVSLRRRSS